jgi:crossover junction endodeoxyribonuclease RuvC
MMRILGIDPGIAIVGYGVVDAHRGKFSLVSMGASRTPTGIPVEKRLEMVYDDICELIDTYKPDCMSCEELFFNTNQKTAIAVAEARGVILLAAMKKNLDFYEYTPLQVKQSVVGYGRAEKKQVMEMVKMFLHLDKVPKLDDTADALALAICHAHASESKIQGFYNLKKEKLL